MAIQKKVFERVLSMAQMYNIGVLHRGPNMLWTCRWHEGERESSIGYQLVRNPHDKSIKLRLRYQVAATGKRPESNMDYTVGVKTSLSYKRKPWFWFVCPLVINGKACSRRVRNLYFLPNSDYFGCKHCRDMMIRSLPLSLRNEFRQTTFVRDAKKPQTSAGGFVPDLNLGWRPSPKREICQKCGCLSEGLYCCNCSRELRRTEQEDFFEMLGVERTASPEEVHVAFKTRLKEYHPDRVAHLGEKIRKVAEEEIKLINQAYEILKDPRKREEHERELAANRASSR